VDERDTWPVHVFPHLPSFCLKKTATDFGFLGVSLVSEEEEEEEEEEWFSVEWSDKEFFSQILSTIAASLPFLLQFLLFASLSFPPPLAIGVSVLFV